jgi:hypothetical protein
MSPMIRRAVVAASAAALGISMLGVAGTPASAATASTTASSGTVESSSSIAFNYWIDAKTTLKKLNQTVTIPRGTFKGSIDIATSQLTGTIALPQATAPFNVAGLPLATATFKMTQVKPVTGFVDLSTATVTATATVSIQIVKVTPIGLPFVNLVGNSCKTSTPVVVKMSGLITVGVFSGTYTIPPLANCGASTTALNLVIPGPGNTFRAVATPM